ncbi:hypothetical protein AKJ37_03630 [candidate division MSBL1 archaeon SCGC-AAA259I09]|uniref:Uncharacterized protein n=2 Tax=candidate division MSBL1 TaxID=215777 RepID=A0A133USD6_9EURY|nr:hypothetical protein AKJ66_02315 [candidate division MSBL1 archaeon SCGC-AAA259E22]KXA97154.1 hypothetical protein AKJ37_03630 [candidate division MSBL1 archaeon SCGC-AAA259I09]
MKGQSDALKFIVVGILISAVVMIGTRWLLPMIFGVTFTGLVAMISNRLSAVGGASPRKPEKRRNRHHPCKQQRDPTDWGGPGDHFQSHRT